MPNHKGPLQKRITNSKGLLREVGWFKKTIFRFRQYLEDNNLNVAPRTRGIWKGFLIYLGAVIGILQRTISNTPSSGYNGIIGTGITLEKLEKWIKYMKQLFLDFGQQVVWNCDL